MDPCLLFACFPRPKRVGERLEQRVVAERLEQALRGPLRQQARTDSFVTVRGDEHNRNRLPPPCQYLLQIGSRHGWHGDVEDQATGLTDELRREESRCR